MNLTERGAALAERDAALAGRDPASTAERALVTAAVVKAKTMELDAGLASWVTVEQLLMTGSSDERDAEYMIAEGFAAAAGDDHLAADRALRVL